ncbi:hypothetical protein niasHT_025947 [Heterodera trifolii]|uniref:TPM domain-containing protein n=1 Tax=Heterodera trifolii TaxID=157864 RepID=A0ABD2KND6_9BILA
MAPPLFFATFCVVPFFALLAFAADWTVSNYPNPRTDFQMCSMTAAEANLCDPDGLLTTEEREKLNKALAEMSKSIGLGRGESKCDKKGLTAVLAIANHISKTANDQSNAAKKMADGLMRRWHLDDECGKAFVMLVAVGDKKFWTSRMKGVPIVGTEFTRMFTDQKNLFRSGKYAEGLENIVKEIGNRMEGQKAK